MVAHMYVNVKFWFARLQIELVYSAEFGLDISSGILLFTWTV